MCKVDGYVLFERLSFSYIIPYFFDFVKMSRYGGWLFKKVPYSGVPSSSEATLRTITPSPPVIQN
jgi:hypothetical protein